MKKHNITLSLALAAVFSASTAFAEAEVTGKIVHESAKFTTSGTTIGAATSQDKEYYKQETSARIFIDGDASDNATFHVELQAFKDGKAGTNYDGNDAYTQRDALREAYVDTEINGISVRAGKQQVVWGTADGMKLLDAINPTDFSEMAQNQMEDSRIPVWMINAETTNADGSEIQVVLSQPKSNFIAGLSTINNNSERTVSATRNPATGFATAVTHNTSATDQGQAFIMKGVDSISGASNGILNIVPELAQVATTFGNLSAGFAEGSTTRDPDTGAVLVAGFAPSYHLNNWIHANVNDFVTNTGNGSAFGGACPGVGIYNGVGTGSTTPASAYCLQGIAANTNEGQANLLSGMDSTADGNNDGTWARQGYGDDGVESVSGTWDAATPDTTFEYMPDASFKTFATFASAGSKYVREDYDSELNAALRYKNTTASGVNYSLNYMNTYDANPHVTVEWQNAAGTTLNVTEYLDDVSNENGTGSNYTSIILDDGTATKYGYVGSEIDSSYTINPVTLVLKEQHAKIQNIGGSLDTAIETASLGPVVLRGEFMYQKDVMSPVIDKAKMSIGNITEAFTAVKGDRFKFVMGADITVLTNMMVSAQIIQDRNLDFVDTTTTINGVTGARYTADMPTMAMDNQYQKAEENKEFYSLFFSKPFGASGEHRWNNIFMFEENGGKWNRLDAEFSINDETQVTVEYNKYWGDANTQFGQLEASSNIQAGFKYSF